MPKLFGRRYSRDELLRKVGRIEQVAGLRPYELLDGSEKGVRAVDFDTGSGLRFTVLVDRGLDVAAATWNGRALAWRAPVGEIGPAYYEPQGLGWLRTFHGGLLVTCGLSNVGWAVDEDGRHFGLHGRYSTIPAKQVSMDSAWDGDEYRFWVKGRVQETVIFNENLTVTRTISSAAGADALEVHDVIENSGYRTTPCLVLYHMNFGFPLIDAGTRLVVSSSSAEPRDEQSKAGAAAWHTFSGPTCGFKEQVFLHRMKPDADGLGHAALVNDALDGGFGVHLSFTAATLPIMTEWKMMGEQDYLVGLEPGNCFVEGRITERQKRGLVELGPGGRIENRLRLEVLTSAKAVAAVCGAIGRITK
jgi:hypothetical protein